MYCKISKIDTKEISLVEILSSDFYCENFLDGGKILKMDTKDISSVMTFHKIKPPQNLKTQPHMLN